MTRRRLPHLYPPDASLFVTWHLHGSLPQSLYPPPGKQSAGEAFVWMDRYLDCTRTGPMFLKQPAIANLIVNTLHDGASKELYQLDAFVVMANHVHVLWTFTSDPVRTLQWVKGTTARQANQLLGRTGKPFWQRESYDHWARDHEERLRIAAYIENNPVKAGLVAAPELYPWSSAGERVAKSAPGKERGVKSALAQSAE